MNVCAVCNVGVSRRYKGVRPRCNRCKHIPAISRRDDDNVFMVSSFKHQLVPSFDCIPKRYARFFFPSMSGGIDFFPLQLMSEVADSSITLTNAREASYLAQSLWTTCSRNTSISDMRNMHEKHYVECCGVSYVSWTEFSCLKCQQICGAT